MDSNEFRVYLGSPWYFTSLNLRESYILYRQGLATKFWVQFN